MFGLEAVVIELLFKLIVAVLALAIGRLALVVFDKTLDFNFKSWINNASDQAVSVYFGLRFLGVCVLIGFALS